MCGVLYVSYNLNKVVEKQNRNKLTKHLAWYLNRAKTPSIQLLGVTITIAVIKE